MDYCTVDIQIKHEIRHKKVVGKRKKFSPTAVLGLHLQCFRLQYYMVPLKSMYI